MYWFGVRAPARGAGPRRDVAAGARSRMAGDTGVDLLWCMATPADLCSRRQFDHVVAVRTSDDYRFAADPAMLWTWFLTVNRAGARARPAGVQGLFFSVRAAERRRSDRR